jgi:hypothetical protein
MPIIDLQRRIAEAGRIRLGVVVTEEVRGRARTRPEKLERFRFTSPDRRRIEAVAARYGGRVEPWQSPAGQQWQVISEAAEIDVVVPPEELAFSQWYELWSAAGCQRRCDGATEQISDGPCLCDPEQRECEIHTRLSVLLRDIPGLGVWRLDTQGWYAAKELAAAVQVITLAAGRGRLLPARLRVEPRTMRRPGPAGKPETRHFVVPVIDVDISPAELLGGTGAAGIAQLERLAPPAITPVPSQEPPVPSIAEQSAPPPPPKLRTPEIPASGRKRRAARAEQPADEQAAGGDGQAPAGGITLEEFRRLANSAQVRRGRIVETAERLFGRELALQHPQDWGFTEADWLRLAVELGLIAEVAG